MWSSKFVERDENKIRFMFRDGRVHRTPLPAAEDVEESTDRSSYNTSESLSMSSFRSPSSKGSTLSGKSNFSTPETKRTERRIKKESMLHTPTSSPANSRRAKSSSTADEFITRRSGERIVSMEGVEPVPDNNHYIETKEEEPKKKPVKKVSKSSVFAALPQDFEDVINEVTAINEKIKRDFGIDRSLASSDSSSLGGKSSRSNTKDRVPEKAELAEPPSSCDSCNLSGASHTAKTPFPFAASPASKVRAREILKKLAARQRKQKEKLKKEQESDGSSSSGESNNSSKSGPQTNVVVNINNYRSASEESSEDSDVQVSLSTLQQSSDDQCPCERTCLCTSADSVQTAEVFEFNHKISQLNEALLYPPTLSSNSQSSQGSFDRTQRSRYLDI